jgi:hypothetical protein
MRQKNGDRPRRGHRLQSQVEDRLPWVPGLRNNTAVTHKKISGVLDKVKNIESITPLL